MSEKYLKYLILSLVVLGILFLISRLLRYLLKRYFERSVQKGKTDPTQYKFLQNALSLIVFIIGITVLFLIIPELRSLGVTLFAGAGILTIIIGFASQQAFANIVSGVFIVIFKPFRVGDFIKIGQSLGEVEDITLRHTVIKSFENRRIVIPNSVISSETILNSNITDPKTCMFVEMGISYESDIDLAIKIMQEEAEKHSFFIDNRSPEEIEEKESPVAVRLIGFGESSVNLRAYVWSPDPVLGFRMKCDLLKSCKKRFDEEGIEIPYPHRTLVYKNDLSRE